MTCHATGSADVIMPLSMEGASRPSGLWTAPPVSVGHHEGPRRPQSSGGQQSLTSQAALVHSASLHAVLGTGFTHFTDAHWDLTVSTQHPLGPGFSLFQREDRPSALLPVCVAVPYVCLGIR